MMVCDDLREKISHAMQRMRKVTVLDEITLKICLNDISRALLDADFPTLVVHNMERTIQKVINDLPAGSKDSKIIQQAIFSELCNMLDSGKPVLLRKKSESTVIMCIGLHGSGKDTVCGKFASHLRGMSLKSALVCADTFTPGALDRLKNVALQAKVPVYGSYTEINPAKVAVKGIEKFRAENRDLIIVDTDSRRHKQYTSLFEEMRQIAKTVKPDLVILVMDSRIGHAASVHAQAFKQSFDAGAIILTNIKGNKKAGGALSSVAAAKCLLFLTETEERDQLFTVFDVKPFVTLLCKKTPRKPCKKTPPEPCKKTPREPCKIDVMGWMNDLQRLTGSLMVLFLVLCFCFLVRHDLAISECR